VRSIKTSLPGCQYGLSLYYLDANGNRAETDAVIAYDDVIIVVESKAGALSYRACRGDTSRIRRDFASLVNDAFVQASRTAAYIRGNDRAVFHDERGNESLVINRKRIRRIYLVNVVKDAIDPFAVELADARSKGLLSNEITDWPWTVFINDLQIVTSILDSPAQLLTYFEHRQRFNDQKEWMLMQDEMDLLHYSIKTGFLLDKSRFDPMATLIWQADMNDFYQYFEGPELGEDPGPKPALNLPSMTMSLVQGCERSGLSGRMAVAVCLMTLGHSYQSELQRVLPAVIEKVTTRDRPQRCQFIIDGEGLSCWFYSEWNADIANHLRSDDRLLKYKNKADKWITAIFILKDGQLILTDVGVQAAPWKPDREMEACVASAARQLLADEKHTPLKIGRNSPCQCGSGKKLKRCCGR